MATPQARALPYLLEDSKQRDDRRKHKQQRLEAILACVAVFVLKLQRYLTLLALTPRDTDGIE